MTAPVVDEFLESPNSEVTLAGELSQAVDAVLAFAQPDMPFNNWPVTVALSLLLRMVVRYSRAEIVAGRDFRLLQ